LKRFDEDEMIDGIRDVAGRSALAIGSAAALLPALAQAARPEPMQLNLQEPVTRVAGQIFELHTLMMIIILVIFVAVFGVMFYSIYAHRKSVGAKAAQFHENTTVEIIWTVVPFVILVGMAWPATKVVLNMKDTANSDLTIKATGYQWKWGYDYPKGEGEGIAVYATLSTPREQIEGSAPKGENYLLETDNNLVVPVGRKVRILTTANDVIHSWWVPAFGVKQDAIPGFVRDTWFRADKEGIYRGQCAELCGKDHGFMPIVVEVVSADKYAAWVGDQKKKMAAAAEDPNKAWTVAELIAKGEKAFQANCAACHQASGVGIPGAFPSLVGAKTVLGPPDAQIAIILKGRKGVYQPTSQMPAQNALSDTDIAAIITFTRNAWGNKAEDNEVLPTEVKTARK